MNEQGELTRIYDRLDGIDTKLGVVQTAVTEIGAACKICQPIVLGRGGKDSINSRVTRLETFSLVRSKGFWVLIAAAVMLLSGIVLSVGQAVAGKLWGG